MILYLTPNGNDPTEYSIDYSLKNDLFQRDVLKIISYGKEIRRWLKMCNSSDALRSEKIRQSIGQYLEIINEISYDQD